MNLKVVCSICTFITSLCHEKQLIYTPKKSFSFNETWVHAFCKAESWQKAALSPEQAVSSHVPGCDAWCRTAAEASVTWKMSQG